ncbi:uncharacterized protein LOC125491542 isoform X2 [Beta vulgaris subsp. vulgaris]|uniref:uncharacterized protein LOC125491542 isoform X2 n=1 Tax=Beta vulgaris subsp. vulgaris TaxID=3555 RepID=UPI0025478870|nr:uncharacterized protein LOC125491542 isoform X2 [Beta vulgaris subsp. vulgaris]
MAFRGRGRGRGFGGSDYKFAKQEPFVLYPDIELPDRNNVPEEKELAVHNHRLRNLSHSPYNLGETASEDTVDIERYSDKAKAKLTDYIKLEHGYFPEELLEGTSRTTCRRRKCNGIQKETLKSWISWRIWRSFKVMKTKRQERERR